MWLSCWGSSQQLAVIDPRSRREVVFAGSYQDLATIAPRFHLAFPKILRDRSTIPAGSHCDCGKILGRSRRDLGAITAGYCQDPEGIAARSWQDLGKVPTRSRYRDLYGQQSTPMLEGTANPQRKNEETFYFLRKIAYSTAKVGLSVIV